MSVNYQCQMSAVRVDLSATAGGATRHLSEQSNHSCHRTDTHLHETVITGVDTVDLSKSAVRNFMV